MNVRAIHAVRLRADTIRPYGDSVVSANLLQKHCRGGIDASRRAVRFRRNAPENGTFYRREWCSAQRIRITMIAGGNHSIISMNASPTVGSHRIAISDVQTPIQVIGLKQQTRKLLFTQKGCHPERAQRVEGSTHFVSLSGKFSAKILRLCCASLRMTGFSVA